MERLSETIVMLTELQITLFCLIFGACIGSFLNVLIWRLPRDAKADGRSICPHCKQVLGPTELIPLVSFFMQRGRCRRCGASISWRYPLIEGITAVLFAYAAWHLTSVDLLGYITLLRTFFIIAVCVTVFVIDLEHYLILDKIVFPAAGVILASNILVDVMQHASPLHWPSMTLAGLVAAVLAALPFWALWYFSKGKWMGFGDVKLVGLMGLMLGGLGIIVGLFAAFMIGAVVSVGLVLFGKKELSSKVPFGTFLTIGTIIALFWALPLADWYVQFLGVSNI